MASASSAPEPTEHTAAGQSHVIDIRARTALELRGEALQIAELMMRAVELEGAEEEQRARVAATAEDCRRADRQLQSVLEETGSNAENSKVAVFRRYLADSIARRAGARWVLSGMGRAKALLRRAIEATEAEYKQ